MLTFCSVPSLSMSYATQISLKLLADPEAAEILQNLPLNHLVSIIKLIFIVTSLQGSEIANHVLLAQCETLLTKRISDEAFRTEFVATIHRLVSSSELFKTNKSVFHLSANFLNWIFERFWLNLSIRIQTTAIIGILSSSKELRL